jgi:membrane associated rhomboid family serine protease
MLGLIIINWNAFNGRPELEQMRCFITLFMILAIFLNLSLTGGSSATDYTGHLGGSIVGIFWSFAFFPRI